MQLTPKAKKVIDTYGSLKTQRNTWESHWQDVADYMLPRKADIGSCLFITGFCM